MATLSASSSSIPLSVLYSARGSSSKPKPPRVMASFGEVVSKDMEYLKKRIGRGVQWANGALRIPQLSKSLDRLLWLRMTEDPLAASLPPPSWPQPSYPGLSGVDLFMADLKALDTYASYFYHLSKLWSKPLPEVYDPLEVADYFNRRPHIVALRLLEVFSSFAFAAIRIRTSGITMFYGSNMDRDINGNISPYNFGMVLKETMLNLGPTFIKVTRLQIC